MLVQVLVDGAVELAGDGHARAIPDARQPAREHLRHLPAVHAPHLLSGSVTIHTRPDQIAASGASRGSGRADGKNGKLWMRHAGQVIAAEACGFILHGDGRGARVGVMFRARDRGLRRALHPARRRPRRRPMDRSRAHHRRWRAPVRV